jgi:hypothetical protein
MFSNGNLKTPQIANSQFSPRHYIPFPVEMQPLFPDQPVEYPVEIRWIAGGRAVERMWKT